MEGEKQNNNNKGNSPLPQYSGNLPHDSHFSENQQSTNSRNSLTYETDKTAVKNNQQDTAQYRTRPAVKTYRDYAVNALKDKPTSLAKMIIKEKKKEELNYQYSPKNKKNIFMIVLSVVLVLLGIISIAAIVLLSVSKKEEINEKDKAVAPKSVLYFDYKLENDLDSMGRKDIVKLFSNAIANTNIPIGDVKIYYFTKKDKFGYKKLALAGEFFKVLDTRAPAQLLRNLENEFTTGVIALSEGTMPFMIFKIKDFDAVYTATIGWEKTLLFDLGAMFSINKKYYAQKFSDLSLYNKDARVILDEEGRIIFGYSFLDLDTLVFFTSNLEFKSIITSLRNNRERK